MLKTKSAKLLIKILVTILIGTILVGIVAPRMPKTQMMESTMQYLDEDKRMVESISGVTMALSFVITLLPDDVGSPIANTLSDMSQFFIFILAVVFVEQLIVVEGSGLVMTYLVPIICALLIIYFITNWRKAREFATKLIILGVAVIIVIPAATHFTRLIGSKYIKYVNDTIEETSISVETFSTPASSDENKSMLDKISDSFENTTNGFANTLNGVKANISKLGNAIAIMLVTTFVVPILVLLFFRWLLSELFKVNIKIPELRKNVKNNDEEGAV